MRNGIPTKRYRRSRAQRVRLKTAAEGQSMVEFALAVPIFLALLFGCLEVGLLYKTHSAFDEAVLQGTRVAAAAGQSSDADEQALAQLQSTLAGENLSNVTAVTIYDSTVSGAFVVTPTLSDNAHTTFVYSPTVNAFVCQYPTSATIGYVCDTTRQSWWDPTSRNVTVGSLDHIGISITYRYKGVTRAIGSLTLTQSASTLMEPQTYGP